MQHSEFTTLCIERHLERSTPGYFVYNLGTGVGVSVLEMVKAMENVRLEHYVNDDL